MLRLIIVLPIYLGFAALLPQTPVYERLAQALAGLGGDMQWHIAGYAIALILTGFGAWFIEYRILPFSDRHGAALRVLRMGFIGVFVASAFQLFMFATEQPLSVFILTLPVIFMVAEVFYELAEAMLDRARLRRMREITDRSRMY